MALFKSLVYGLSIKNLKGKGNGATSLQEKSESEFHSKRPYNFSILVGLYPKCFLKT
jgi:hypothetical protein